MNFKTPVMIQGKKIISNILLRIITPNILITLNLHLGSCLFIVIHSLYIMNRLEQNK